MARNIGGTFLLQVMGTGLSFLVAILLARLLGASELGSYQFVLSLTMTLLVFSVLGTDRLLEQRVASYVDREQGGLLRGILQWALLVVFSAGLVLAAGVGFLLTGYNSGLPDVSEQLLWVGLSLLPVVAIFRSLQGVLRSLRRAAWAVAPQHIVLHLCFAAGLGLAMLLSSGHLDAATAMVVRVGSAGIVLAVGAFLVWRFWPAMAKETDSQWRGKEWLRCTIPLAVVAGLGKINARVDILLLGGLATASNVGVYSVALRGARIVLFVFFAMNQTMGAEFSRLYGTGEFEELEALAVRSALITFLASLPLALLFFWFGEFYLTMFGLEFVRGWGALAILVFGQWFALSGGLGGYLLMMTGHEKTAAAVEAMGAGLNVVLNIILIPMYGMEGAAIATVSSLALSILLHAWFVGRRLGFNPSLWRLSGWPDR